MNSAPQFHPFVPDVSLGQFFQFIHQSFFVGQVTGWIFSIGLAVFLVSAFVSIVFFAISAGRLEMVERSRLWLIFGCVWLGITGLIWAIFQIVLIIFSR